MLRLVKNFGAINKSFSTSPVWYSTFVVTQDTFEDAVSSLIELDYDAIEAYEAAINRIEDESSKEKLNEFADDHRRHVKELREVLNQRGMTAPNQPDMK